MVGGRYLATASNELIDSESNFVKFGNFLNVKLDPKKEKKVGSHMIVSQEGKFVITSISIKIKKKFISTSKLIPH